MSLWKRAECQKKPKAFEKSIVKRIVQEPGLGFVCCLRIWFLQCYSVHKHETGRNSLLIQYNECSISKFVFIIFPRTTDLRKAFEWFSRRYLKAALNGKTIRVLAYLLHSKRFFFQPNYFLFLNSSNIWSAILSVRIYVGFNFSETAKHIKIKFGTIDHNPRISVIKVFVVSWWCHNQT